LCLVAAALVLLLALVSYEPTDPSSSQPRPALSRTGWGRPGAYLSDLLLSLFGPPAGLLLPLLAVLGLRLARASDAGRWGRAIILSLGGVILIALPRRF
jgi:S-DNA-T family DNA segregation ATPase FtsK/SpoIIIE